MNKKINYFRLNKNKLIEICIKNEEEIKMLNNEIYDLKDILNNLNKTNYI